LEDARASRSGALVIRGEPGIGKTALLDDTRDRATDMHVLSARGVESESDLPFAALHQLFRTARDHIAALPSPQANALEAALGFGHTEGQERFLVFVACLSLLSELAERGPVLCLIDDAHWLDTGSTDALLFVTRRLDAEGVVILFAARDGETNRFDAPGVPSLDLKGLDGEAAETLLARGAGIEAATHVRRQLLDQTAGNALALLEIPSVLTRGQLSGEQPLPESLPLTRHVEGVFLERVRRLDPDTQRLLVIAAADDSEDAAIVARATAAGEPGLSALDRAEEAGLVSVDGTRLKFRHPLVRSAVYGAATSSERRAAHRALAYVLAGDPEQLDRRAWHLAGSSLEPDETVALLLDAAAQRAMQRGAFGAAVRALERAAELSTKIEARARRLVEAARCASIAGADEQAIALADHARLLVADDARGRAELAWVVGRAEIRRGRPADAPPLLMKAASEVAPLDPGRALELLLDAAWAGEEAGDRDTYRALRGLADGLASSADDEQSALSVDLLTGLGAIADEDPAAAFAHLGRAVSVGAETDDPLISLWAGAAALFLGDGEQAGKLFTRGVALARARGAFGLLAPALAFLGVQRFAGQQYDQAVLAATEAEQFAQEIHAENLLPLSHFVLGYVAAIRGDDDEAVRRADATLELVGAHGLASSANRPIWVLAVLDLGRGRWADALARLETLSSARMSLASTMVVRSIPDRIEAAVRAGQPEAARPALSALEDFATRTNQGWAGARLASCRALMTGGDDATTHFEEALRLSAEALPFDLARIHLLYGEHLRRERRRTDSRVQLRAALEAFERFGAEPWAERARTELRASGETARRRDPSTTAQLTPQELQIARFVAEGLSNKEVAAQLFLSPRTIDSHLRNVFSKLAISSRTQLARIPLGGDVAPVAA
jgi:DNA-binding CsgD family transcriptional regulator/tetratricopeptide (TPR) repeat protein